MNEKAYTYEYPRPAVTTDCVVFCNSSDGMSVLLIERANEPYKGCWALPGGFLDIEEDGEACAIRELKEETGLQLEHMNQIGTFTEVDRDPRGRTISIAYYAFVEKTEVKGSDDATQAKWFPVDSVPALAFDHDKILSLALEVNSKQYYK